jgi:hypothetical protein
MKKVILTIAVLALALFAYKWVSTGEAAIPEGTTALPFGVDAMYLMSQRENPKPLVDSDVDQLNIVKPSGQNSYLSKVIVSDSHKVLIALPQADSMETLIEQFKNDDLIKIKVLRELNDQRIAIAYSRKGQSVVALLLQNQETNFSQVLYLPSVESTQLINNQIDKLIDELSKKVPVAV